MLLHGTSLIEPIIDSSRWFYDLRWVIADRVREWWRRRRESRSVNMTSLNSAPA
jgi:hypothetical protein